MKYVFVALVANTLAVLVLGDEHIKRFVIVSGYPTAQLYYPRVKDLDLCTPQPNIDIETKRQICADIIGTYSFRRNEQFPTEMSPKRLQRLLNRPRDDYPTKIKLIYLSGEKNPIEESVFVCLTNKDGYVQKYYISEEYNLSVHRTQYLAGRFIFSKRTSTGSKRLHGLAEVPAKNFFSPDYSIEEIYRNRRRAYSVEHSVTDDALCREEEAEKVRICMAVFNAEYFKQKFVFPTSIGHIIEAKCIVQTVSFQTNYDVNGKGVIGRKYRERMLNCDYLENEGRFKYLISQAYGSNEIFIYYRDSATGNVYPESMSTNIRFTVDRYRFYLPGDKENIYEDGKSSEESVGGRRSWKSRHKKSFSQPSFLSKLDFI